jgi:hypothetical protein
LVAGVKTKERDSITGRCKSQAHHPQNPLAPTPGKIKLQKTNRLGLIFFFASGPPFFFYFSCESMLNIPLRGGNHRRLYVIPAMNVYEFYEKNLAGTGKVFAPNTLKTNNCQIFEGS